MSECILQSGWTHPLGHPKVFKIMSSLKVDRIWKSWKQSSQLGNQSVHTITPFLFANVKMKESRILFYSRPKMSLTRNIF